MALSDEVGDDLEMVEVIQRKFDDFQKDLKANEARLVELNTIAERLTAMGQTEAAEKIKIQIEVNVTVPLAVGFKHQFS